MNTSDVVDILADRWDLSKAETRRLLDSVIATFNRRLASGESFTVPELGTFEVTTRESRRSYNPHHEAYMILPPKRVVTFRPSKGLKEEMKHLDQGDE